MRPINQWNSMIITKTTRSIIRMLYRVGGDNFLFKPCEWYPIKMGTKIVIEHNFKTKTATPMKLQEAKEHFSSTECKIKEICNQLIYNSLWKGMPRTMFTDLMAFKTVITSWSISTADILNLFQFVKTYMVCLKSVKMVLDITFQLSKQ